MKDSNPSHKKHILISRTDAIGDVVLTLPMCGIIRSFYPSATISFLGKSYTKDIVLASKYVDTFLNFDDWSNITDEQAILILKDLHIDAIIHVFPQARISEIAKRAGIKTRVGTINRSFHWFSCNKLIRLSRKNSELHESQLNIKLLKGINININPDLKEIHKYYGLERTVDLPQEYSGLLSDRKFNLIIHPKSRGSGKEWDLDRYTQLINLLDPQKYEIFITGSEQEKTFLSSWIKKLDGKVKDVTGIFSLAQFLTFIGKADGLLASGTGPVHLAAAAQIYSLGLYPNTSSINAQRWAPIGAKASYIEAKGSEIDTISATTVFQRISNWTK